MRLIDTNIFVDHLRNYGPAVKFFETLYLSRDIIFSAITEAEIMSGKDCSDVKKRELTLHFLNRFNKIEVSNPIAVLAGDLCRDRNIDLPDAIIAATAILNNAELITRNVKDFKNIDRLKVIAPYK